MTTVLKTTGYTTPTLLALVSRCRREVTKESLTTLNDDPINNVLIDAINDAVSDIYFKSRWNWRKQSWNILWTSAQTDYPLPADFDQLATEIVVNNVALKEISPEEWWRNTYAPSWNSNSSISGQPSIYTVDRALLKVWPLPSDDFVTQTPISVAYYYRQPSSMLVLANDASNSPDVPADFTEALVRFAVARLKVFLQWTDFAIDQKRYEEIVTNRLQTDMLTAHPTRVRPRNWRTANFG